MSLPPVKRILLKLSGEVLMGEQEYGIDPAYVARTFLKSQGVDRAAARLLLDAMGNFDLAALANITIPTGVICGDEDQDNGSAQDLTDQLPNATYYEVPGGHLNSVTKPELGEAIVQFLEEQ